jgi:hypothetical protein
VNAASYLTSSDTTNCNIQSWNLFRWNTNTNSSLVNGNQVSISSAGLIQADTSLFVNDAFSVQIVTSPKSYSYFTPPFQVVVEDCSHYVSVGTVTNSTGGTMFAYDRTNNAF